MPKKNKAWVNQHITDPYVNLAQKDGYRSRAAYKLLEIDQEHHILKNAKVIVDLGCAPGSWSQLLVRKFGSTCHIIGVDLLEIEPLHGLDFVLGDFSEDQVLQSLLAKISGNQVDVVLSDMAPNLSGISGVDQARLAYLIELVLDFAANHLRVGGHCVAKLFQGSEFDNLVKLSRKLFNQVAIYKPKASRAKSSETYLVCKSKL